MQLPGPVRAFVGLIATAADEAKHLPDRAIELPMLAVSSALQMSLRAQQRYARLAARGDDVINRRPPGEEPPPWATFDDPVSADDLRGVGLADPDPALRARAATQLLDELLGVAEDTSAEPGTAAGEPAAKQAHAAKAAKRAPATAKKAPSAPQRSSARKAAAKQAGAAKKTGAANQAGAANNGAARSGKSISRPRHTEPSRFDTVEDD